MTRTGLILIVGLALSACAPQVSEPPAQKRGPAPATQVLEAPVLIEDSAPVIAPEAIQAQDQACDVGGDGIGGTGCPAID